MKRLDNTDPERTFYAALGTENPFPPTCINLRPGESCEVEDAVAAVIEREKSADVKLKILDTPP